LGLYIALLVVTLADRQAVSFGQGAHLGEITHNILRRYLAKRCSASYASLIGHLRLRDANDPPARIALDGSREQRRLAAPGDGRISARSAEQLQEFLDLGVAFDGEEPSVLVQGILSS
jgi:hypothetical protein